jgi:hypothetical protein
MKAITIWQPYATLIALGEKRYETRSWSTTHRGPLAIHAASSTRGIELCRQNPLIVRTLKDHGLALQALPRSGILCIVDLVDCFPVEELWGDLDEYNRAYGDFSPGRFAWELRVTEVFDKPIPAKGMQGLWHFDYKFTDRPQMPLMIMEE